jgi:hypothetical protein
MLQRRHRGQKKAPSREGLGLNPPLEEVEETMGALQFGLWCVACRAND